MSEPQSAAPTPRSTATRGLLGLARGLLRRGGDLLRRTYALLLIVLILYVSYRAIRYLVVELVFPKPPPAQITGVPKRLDEQLLHGARPDWLGLAAVENPRAPLAHYHRFDIWLGSDPQNDCTRSGCHAPLPHAKHKEVRAFLNMHATSLHCGVCHMAVEDRPLRLAWYDPQTGRATDPPPLLAAYAWLETHRPRPDGPPFTDTDQRTIVRLLTDASRMAGGEPMLARLAEHLRAVRAGGEPFRHLVEVAWEAVPRAFRGSYGAKLAVREPGSQKLHLRHPGSEAAVREYLRSAAELGPERRETLLQAVHTHRRPRSLECSDCHRESGSLIDFAALGYPPGRVRALAGGPIFQMIEHIAHGEPFHLPQFMMPSSVPPPPTTNPLAVPEPAPATGPNAAP